MIVVGIYLWSLILTLMANDNIHELPGIDYVDYVNII